MRCFKPSFLLLALVAGVACQPSGQDVPQTGGVSGKSFYAVIEGESGSRVYADEDLRVLWDQDDRISIFDRYTLNEQYRFTGESGANAGWFDPIPSTGFVTGNPLDYVYAVYPYQQSTSISNDGILKVILPAEQAYRKGSFGPGANTMVSVTPDNRLQFRNACGYLVLKFYGEGVQVSSVSLQGSFSEPIAGTAFLSMDPGGTPSLELAADATDEVMLAVEDPVTLPAVPEEAVEFWFALPPVNFTHGFTATVKGTQGDVYYPFTKKAVNVPRNRKVTMAPMELKKTVPGQVTVDKTPVCNLLYVKGKNAEGEQYWEFSDGQDIRVRVSSWRCREDAQDHIGYHVSLVELDIPQCHMSIPLERLTGDDYISGNKSVAGAHLNKYQISDDGTRLDFDLSITLYRETEGDIRIVYSGPLAVS